MFIYLDIETIPGQAPGLREEIAAGITPPGSMKRPETIAKWEAEEKPAAIEDAWRKTAFHGDRGEVVCIAWAIDRGTVQSVARSPDPQHTEHTCERDVLEQFFYELGHACRPRGGVVVSPTFVGHNVRDFDLRFLFQRAVIHGVRPPVRLPHDSRPGTGDVYDTMTAWAGWGGRLSLDRLCRALGVDTKGSELGGEEIDGSKVWDFVLAGRIADVATYCRADVERVRTVHQRLTFQRGMLAQQRTGTDA